jgi:hypothetical protein
MPLKLTIALILATLGMVTPGIAQLPRQNQESHARITVEHINASICSQLDPMIPCEPHVNVLIYSPDHSPAVWRVTLTFTDSSGQTRSLSQLIPGAGRDGTSVAVWYLDGIAIKRVEAVPFVQIGERIGLMNIE